MNLFYFYCWGTRTLITPRLPLLSFCMRSLLLITSGFELQLTFYQYIVFIIKCFVTVTLVLKQCFRRFNTSF